MSTWTEAFLSWNTGVIPTPADFNRIEGNTDYLKDQTDDNAARLTVNESDIDGLEANVNQGVKTSDAPTFTGVTLNGDLNPDSTPTAGSQTVGTSSSWTPGRGVYTMVVTNGTINLEVNVGGSWRAYNFESGTIFTNGSSVRLTNRSTNLNETIRYLKF